MSGQKLGHLVKPYKKNIRSGDLNISSILIKFGQNVCVGDYLGRLWKWVIEDQKRSESQNFEKCCVRHRGHNFSLVFLKDGQKVFLDDISDEW